MSLRVKRQLIRLGVHTAVLAILAVAMIVTTAVQDHATAGVLLLAFLVYWATMKVNPLPRLLEQRVLQQVACQFCGQVVDLVGVWPCRCGFLSWELRHGLAACPNCHREYAWLACPACEATIKT